MVEGESEKRKEGSLTNREGNMLMRHWKFALPAAVLIAFPVAVHAQGTGGTASSAEVESDRLAAATQLVSLMLPATQRDAMVDQMMQSIMSTMIASIKAFFDTPTGQLYARESSGILSDPDIVEWQRNLMTKSFARYPDEIKALVNELENALAEPVEEPKA